MTSTPIQQTRELVPELAVGQTWMYRGRDEYRYLEIASLDEQYVHAKPRRRRKTRIRRDRFARGSRWMYCGHESAGVLPAFSDKPVTGGCLRNVHTPLLDLERICAVGFGAVTVTRDGEEVWVGDDEERTVAEFEALARETAGDWRIRFESPSAEFLYQRQGEDRWVLVFRGMGFA